MADAEWKFSFNFSLKKRRNELKEKTFERRAFKKEKLQS